MDISFDFNKKPYMVKYGGRGFGKNDESLKYDHYTKFFLSSEGFYFKYRNDKNDSRIIRATLYRTKDNSVADDVRVSEGYGQNEKGHHDVINYFEARITLGIIHA